MSLKHDNHLTSFALLPELRLRKFIPLKPWGIGLAVEKTSDFEVCPKCSKKAHAVYDRRHVRIRDEPIRGKAVILFITKRRFSCKACGAVFTEPVPGISKYGRFTKRFEKLCAGRLTGFPAWQTFKRNFAARPANASTRRLASSSGESSHGDTRFRPRSGSTSIRLESPSTKPQSTRRSSSTTTTIVSTICSTTAQRQAWLRL